MIITTKDLLKMPMCADAMPLVKVFAAEYPVGVEFNDLLNRSDKQMPSQFQWLTGVYCDCLCEDMDYSGFKLSNKALLVKAKPCLIDNIGYDDLSDDEKRFIDLYVKR